MAPRRALLPLAITALIGLIAAAVGSVRVLQRHDPGATALEPPPAQEPAPAAAQAPARAAAAPRAELFQEPATLVPADPASGGEARVPVRGPRGRVSASGTGAPLAGVPVRMRFAGKVVAQTVTGSDGAFELPDPEGTHRIVELGDGWRAMPSKQRLDEAQTAGAAEILFEAERILAAPVSGRLLDARTGEPIPDFLLQIFGPREPKREDDAGEDPGGGKVRFEFHARPKAVEDVVTDGDGRFRSTRAFEAGTLDLAPIDHPAERPEMVSPGDGTLAHEHAFGDTLAAPEAELRIAIGPTYRFALAFPEGLGPADFHAVLPGPGGGDRELHRLAAEDAGSPFSMFYGGAARKGLEPRAPLRAGDAPWARFRSPLFQPPASAGSPQALRVRSEDGHWSGETSVTSVEGIYPEVVEIELSAKGALEGTVLDPQDKPVPTAWIELLPTGQIEPIAASGADAKGRFDFRWLDAGEVLVRVQTQRFDEWSSVVRIEAGQTASLDVRLASSVPLGSVSGVLRGRTGRHRSKGGMVVLQSLDDPSFFLMKSATYRKREGLYTAPFTFENVPQGAYELTLHPFDNLRWETLGMTVSAPAEGLEFVCDDDVVTFDLGLHAVDADTGAELQELSSIVWQGDPLRDVRLEDDYESKLYKGVPEGVPLRWVARADGYRLAQGDQTDIPAEGERRTVEVRLERGYGHVFKVTTRDRKPLAGVELLSGGEPMGATDAAGIAVVSLDSPPATLELRLAGWHVGWGTVDPADPQFGMGLETPVYLERDE